MAPTIKNAELGRLAAEASKVTGENETQTVHKGLELQGERSFEALAALMEERIWSKLPDPVRGKGLSQEEQDEILGYGLEGF